MNRLLLARSGVLTVALTLLIGALSPSIDAAGADSKTVELPAGTVVTLVPTGTGGIAITHNIGDPIDFTVKNSVIVDGWVLIPKGAPAHGTIADLTSAGYNGFGFGGHISQASLKFKFDWVQLVTGKLKLDDEIVEVKGRQINRKLGGLFGNKNEHVGGYDPFLTAAEYGVGR